jgi:hypothetical protein
MLRGATLAAVLGLVAAGRPAAHAETPTATRIATLDLSSDFGTRTPWRLVATQGPQDTDALGEPAPGEVRLCLARTEAGPCAAALAAMPGSPPDLWAAHCLNVARMVRPRGDTSPPLLLIQTASLHGVNGSQAIFTQLLAYRREADRFEQVYGQVVGHNNNQEIRYIASGPLKGGVISAEPTQDAPYGFWITVNRLTPEYTYRQVLKYRSATGYNDGNPLAVIDSEMPAIEQRLGLWRPGAPLPLPASACPKPRLVHAELWCSEPPKPTDRTVGTGPTRPS